MSETNTIFNIEARVQAERAIAQVKELAGLIDKLPGTVKINFETSGARAKGKQAGAQLAEGAEEEVKRRPINLTVSTTSTKKARKEILRAIEALEPDAKLNITLTAGNADKKKSTAAPARSAE